MAAAPPPSPAPASPQGTPASLPFRRRHRLCHNKQFQAIYAARKRAHKGPITLFSLPNDVGHPRLGLSVGRRVGNAVTRNRVKRQIREAFRLQMNELPQGFDYVVVIRPHDPLPFATYKASLLTLAQRVASLWQRADRQEQSAS